MSGHRGLRSGLGMVRHDVQNASKVKALRAHSKLAEAPFRFWKRRFRKVNAPIIMAMVSTRDVQTSEIKSGIRNQDLEFNRGDCHAGACPERDEILRLS